MMYQSDACYLYIETEWGTKKKKETEWETEWDNYKYRLLQGYCVGALHTTHSIVVSFMIF